MMKMHGLKVRRYAAHMILLTRIWLCSLGHEFEWHFVEQHV